MPSIPNKNLYNLFFKTEVLNLVISGMPSILKKKWLAAEIEQF